MFGSAEVYNSFTVFPDNGWSQPGTAFHGPHRSKSYYFYYNRVLIVMLNTMATQNATGTAEPVHTAQATWLTKVLQDDKNGDLSNFRIIVTHIPVFSGRNNERWLTLAVRRAYAKIATDHDVDIFFSGHDHVYVRSNPIKFSAQNPALNLNNFPTDPSGTIFTIPAGTGARLDEFRARDAFHLGIYEVKIALPNTSPGVFVNIKVTDDQLNVTAMRTGGEALDTYVIQAKR
jgi:hypothetical protein